MGAFIAKMLLPTVSSLVFLPTASVAAKRGFHMEAMVYFFTMFFTAVRKLKPHSQFSSHVCVCVSALGDFDEPQRSSVTMFGVLTIAVRIYQDRWGYGIYSGPIGSAVFIITVKWTLHVTKNNTNRPKLRRLCATPSFLQTRFVSCHYPSLSPPSLQEWDYAYVHSFYHLSLAVSFVLLLPKRNRYAGTGRNAAKLSCFALCCCSVSPGSSKDKSDQPTTEKKKKKKRSVWTVPTEKPWSRSCSTPTLPLYSQPPSTPIKGPSVSKLKELNGWK
ncbi:protein myomaker [Stegastes partitus]|uniref:Protein myomaker n=1 Tax=Stegastes partitus TaxID=144197 RepID=A0A9Y4NQX6_9TELE|nr:PREDICTED: protein myomaker [Stegastes partitus]